MIRENFSPEIFYIHNTVGRRMLISYRKLIGILFLGQDGVAEQVEHPSVNNDGESHRKGLYDEGEERGV